MYKNYKDNEIMNAILFNNNKIKSYINYRKLLWKIKKSTPDYNTFCTMYEFLDQLNFAYFHYLGGNNHLFIYDSKKDKQNKTLIYKDESVKIMIKLKPENVITLHIERFMGYTQTSITFTDSSKINIENKLDEQLFINCTNLIMNELYYMVKKYRKFGRL